MSDSNIELANLQKAIDTYEVLQGERLVNSEENIKILSILTKFLRKKGLMCYGGIALNNILPKKDQFYSEHELPDYDVFSSNPVKDIKEIADIYYANGYDNCYASSNPIHLGSYKLFVNYMGVLDVTAVPPKLYKELYADRVTIDGINYTPVDFLRRSIYNELSNPEGDVSRFEKVFTRIEAVNKHYPIHPPEVYDSVSDSVCADVSDASYNILVDTLAKYGGIFFGGYALQVYSKYMPPGVGDFVKKHKQIIYAFIDDPSSVLSMLKSVCDGKHIKITHQKHAAVGDIVGIHYEIFMDGGLAGVIYLPIGCHSYNVVKYKTKQINVATIYNILHMYYSFIYINEPYYNRTFLKAIADCLYSIPQTGSGPLNPFPITCYGHQETRESIFENRSKLYKSLIHSENVKKLELYFLKYSPGKLISPKDDGTTTGKEIPIVESTSDTSSSSSDEEWDGRKSFKSLHIKHNHNVNKFNNLMITDTPMNHKSARKGKRPKTRKNKNKYSTPGMLTTNPLSSPKPSSSLFFDLLPSPSNSRPKSFNQSQGIFGLYQKTRKHRSKRS
jgi:hypothetical protein